VQATRTYLELTSPRQFRPAFGDFPNLEVERVTHPTPALYRRCYRTVGEAYHWRDRWDWSDDEIRTHLESPGITLHVATQHDQLVGWYELRHVAADNSVELAYFGLTPNAIGQGLGKHLLSAAVRDAWALRPARVWLHTCSLDHPHALPNYHARGFVPYRTEVYEVAEA
jgi:GNAT superfamily N-acetyltransferase